MIAKQRADITEDDNRALIANAVPEGKTIEYKRELPGNSDGDKKEFLADVSSFANTSGGDLVFGVDEAQGIPSDVVELHMADRDQEIRRVDSIIGTGLEPRACYESRVITFRDGKLVLIIRTDRSWSGPHRVVFKSHGLVAFSGGPQCHSYTQLFRSGIIETVHASLLNHEVRGIKNIPSIGYERIVLEHLPRCLAVIKELEINPPVAVALSLVNVRGSQMFASNEYDLYSHYQLVQDHLILPEAVVDDAAKEPAKILKPIFDLVWNAFGYD